MTDNDLKSLRNIHPPRASHEARERAIGAAMQAFDEAEQARCARRQGLAAGERLMSIFNALRRTSGMDIRIPIGAAAVGLLLVPLALQLNSTTSMTQLPPPGVPLPETRALGGDDQFAANGRVNEQPVDEPVLLNDLRRDGGTAGSGAIAKTESNLETAERPGEGFRPYHTAAPVETEPSGAAIAQRELSQDFAASPPAAPDAAMNSASRVRAEEQVVAPGYARSGDRFENFDDAQVIAVADQPVSTFSIDVDTASYAYVRRSLEDGRMPAPDAVRVEEMINYFQYDYPEPDSASVPFQPTVAVYPTPWNPDTRLMHIGIKGFTPAEDAERPANLVFLIDTSGSMDEPDKLPLLKRAFALLVNELDADDTVSIVTYAGSAGTVLWPTPASERGKILAALDNLSPGGRTAGAAGIEEAYRLAERARLDDGVNRVILATDGDFNVGISSTDELEAFIADKRDEGIFLSVLGFGTGNYNDALMQTLAQNGNGNAAYIDSFAEARKVLVEEAGSTLVTIAKDVKIQIEFNPSVVAEYRLVGYETRSLAREDFNNDRVDAGDVGAGHTVTAIYEITPVGAPAQGVDPLRYGQELTLPDSAGNEEFAFLKLRYKLPDENTSRLIEMPVTQADAVSSPEALGNDIRFAAAVAAFGQKLRGGQFADRMSYEEIAELARAARGEDPNGYRTQFVSLVSIAESLAGPSDR